MNNDLENNDIKFKHPFTCILAGRSGCGKSLFCIKFLQHLDSLCTEQGFEVGIIWCYSEKNAVPTSQLAALARKSVFTRGTRKFCKCAGQSVSHNPRRSVKRRLFRSRM